MNQINQMASRCRPQYRDTKLSEKSTVSTLSIAGCWTSLPSLVYREHHATVEAAGRTAHCLRLHIQPLSLGPPVSTLWTPTQATAGLNKHNDSPTMAPWEHTPHKFWSAVHPLNHWIGWQLNENMNGWGAHTLLRVKIMNNIPSCILKGLIIC